jgi:predicted porin
MHALLFKSLPFTVHHAGRLARRHVKRPSFAKIAAAAKTASAAVALFIASVATSVAQAQSSVTLYGLVDASVGQFQSAGGLKVKRLDSGNMSTSYLGFKGKEDLGGGTSAGFTLESFFLVDSGGASRVPGVDSFWSRNAFVNLAGGFGNVRLGRMGAPLFVSTLIFNAFGDSFGYSPAIRQYFAAPYGTPVVGDTAWNNTFGYSSPNLGGFRANLFVSAGEGAATAKGRNLGGNVLYFAGPFAATAAWQQVKVQGTLGRGISAFAGFQSQTSYEVAGSYDLGAVKLFLQYGKVKTDAIADVTTTNIHFSAKAPIGAGFLLATYGDSKIATQNVGADKKSQMLSLGYDYFLSKRTDLYAVYMLDKYTNLANGNTLALGVKHTF